ncbi:hypothetical protein M422DRAFT_35932, partial [Sphaerobolus stellatus SS14]
MVDNRVDQEEEAKEAAHQRSLWVYFSLDGRHVLPVVCQSYSRPGCHIRTQSFSGSWSGQLEATSLAGNPIVIPVGRPESGNTSLIPNLCKSRGSIWADTGRPYSIISRPH